MQTRWLRTTLTTRSAGSTAWWLQVRVTSAVPVCATVLPACQLCPFVCPPLREKAPPAGPSGIPPLGADLLQEGPVPGTCAGRPHPFPSQRWEWFPRPLVSPQQREGRCDKMLHRLDRRKCLPFNMKLFRLYQGLAKQDFTAVCYITETLLAKPLESRAALCVAALGSSPLRLQATLESHKVYM